jgi:hypothetical protein
MNLYDVVALLEDLPDQSLKRGQVGTLVEIWENDIYEVEFADTNGIPYAMVALPASQLMVLYWHPDSSRQGV